ncbi:thioredoxin domain-containing protein [Fibrobacterota bacterium]
MTQVLSIIAMTLVSSSHTSAKKMPEDPLFTNRLAGESSPYLLAHAHNPVNWYPWGEDALQKARDENKMLIISIGYAACHWCHVMEKESFSDREVADIMNRDFVSIKIDREERPDLDNLYMTAAQLLTGRGGWPLNVIALPDGRPVFAGTYFPKTAWKNALLQIPVFFRENPGKMKEQAKLVAAGLRGMNAVRPDTTEPEFRQSHLFDIFESIIREVDFTHGGFGNAPKFPMPVAGRFLLRYYHFTRNDSALRAVETALDRMARGGIYDQLGGGFARYSTDQVWKVPHFEKMLYDNAQLVSLYAFAFQLTKKPLYKRVVYQTLDFIKREMTSPEGGFYSSLDADSRGEEGKFYLWTRDEIKNDLGKDADLVLAYYNMSGRGNWEEGKNVLHREIRDEDFAIKQSLTVKELGKRVEHARRKLFKIRSQRSRPSTDDKILTAWNAMMLQAYVNAYRVFDDERFLYQAERNARFILKHMYSQDGRLNRSYKEGKSSINAFLDDYGFTISAFISLYQATFDEEWLYHARDLLKYVIRHFYDDEKRLFYYTSDLDPELIARHIDIMDNVIPSSNSLMAENLFLLGKFFYKEDMIEKSRQMLQTVKKEVVKGGIYFSNWSRLMVDMVDPLYELAIVGPQHINRRRELDRRFMPNVLVIGGNGESSLPLMKNKMVNGQTTLYVCRNRTCRKPVTKVADALRQMKQE